MKAALVGMGFLVTGWTCLCLGLAACATPRRQPLLTDPEMEYVIKLLLLRTYDPLPPFPPADKNPEP